MKPLLCSRTRLRCTRGDIFDRAGRAVEVRAEACLASLPRCGCRSRAPRYRGSVSLTLNNVGIVVADLDTVADFFEAIGLEREGRAVIEGVWAGQVTGLGDQQVEIVMMRTPDGHGRLELSRFIAPEVIADHRTAPVNALGYLRVMFAVDDLDETLDRARAHGAVLVSTDVVQFQDSYRLCYIRGPEGVLIGLAEALE